MRKTRYSYFNVTSGDGKDVRVTPRSLCIGNVLYPREDIYKYKIAAISSNKVPAFVLIAIGVIIGSAVQYKVITQEVYKAYDHINTFTPYPIALIEGIAVVLIGMGTCLLMLLRTKYALRLLLCGTEEVDVIKSRKKQYIEHVAAKLNGQTDCKKRPQTTNVWEHVGGF